MRTDGYMPPSDGWVPPSSKKLHKLPTIHIGNKDVANRMKKWYDENEEADNLLPPYKDYIIHFKKSELQHDIIVHYQENMRELHAQLITDGKKRELIYTNFDIREKGNKLVPEGEVPDTREYDCKHIREKAHGGMETYGG